MNIISSILNTFVGNKSKKDLKKVEGIVKKILEHEQSFASLTNDELRAKTFEFKALIDVVRKPHKDKVDELNAKISSVTKIDEKEEFYKEIDKINEISNDEVDLKLTEILPQAFAVVKETAKRFKNNSEIKVTVLEHDLIFSQKSYVTVNGKEAYWKNKWDAAGKEVVWDMVHYDVQLVGGIALHDGKIAEMQTGEGKTLVATLPVYLNALTGNGVHLVTVND